MMRRAGRIALLAVCVSAGAAAAPEDRNAGFERMLRFDTLVDRCRPEFGWMADGKRLGFDRIEAEGRVFYRLDPASPVPERVFDTAKLRAALAQAIGHEPLQRGVPFAGFTEAADGWIEFELEGNRFRLQPQTMAIVRQQAGDPVEDALGLSARVRQTPVMFKREMFLAGETDTPEIFSRDGTWLTSLKGGDIWLRSTVDGRAKALTAGATADIGWDFDVTGISPWSPESQRLFALQYDRSQVLKVPRIHFLQPDQGLDWARQQKAGAPVDKAQPYILSVLGRAPLKLELGDTTDQYFRLLGWMPDGNAVLFARFSRDFRRADVLSADARTGQVRTLLTETGSTFVREISAMIWSGPVGFTLLPGNAGFIWESERDGNNHLYLYGMDGKLQRQLTRGPLPVRGVVRVDARQGFVYYLAPATEQRPYDRHLFRVPLAGGERRQLTDGDGQHQVRFSPSGESFTDSFSTVAKPPRTLLRAADGRQLADLGEADIRRLQEGGWTAPEEFVVKAADGKTDLHGVLIKPADFDPNRSYPLVEYIYGGPQSAVTPRSFCPRGRGDLAYALAQTGVLVAVLDGTGTPERSKAFQDVAVGDWADHVVRDHAGAIRQLGKARPYIDLDKVGVYGWSWGGYFAFRLLADQPDLYKAAVSGVPGFDPQGGIIYEPYLGLPDTSPATYAAASPFRLAPKVKGNLLLIGGTLDSSTLADVYKMVDAMVAADRPHQLLVLPNQEHHFTGHGAQYQFRAIRDFFARELPR